MNESAENHRFFLVTGVGHCGTKWLAQVLNRPQDGMVCFHEQKVKMYQNIDYRVLLQYEDLHGVGSIFQPYFAFMRSQMQQHDITGDSNSWPMRTIPAFVKVWPTDLVILLVRNGIQCVHSMHYTHLHWERNNWVYTQFFRTYWELLGHPFREDWNSLTPWEYWCFNWYLNLRMPQILEEKLGKDRLLVLRLEDLTQDTGCLAALINRVNPSMQVRPEDLQSIQQEDVNRKIKGDREPVNLWNQWPEKDRAAFREFCQDTMEHYGYEIPGS